MSQYLPIALFSFLFTLALTLLALKVFPKLGLLDRPQKYGLKRAPIPYYGGLVIVASFVIGVLVFVPLNAQVLSLLLAALLLATVSFLDDKYSLPPLLRLFVQGIVALIVVFGGVGIHSISNPFGEAFTLDSYLFKFVLGDYMITISLLSALFTVFWVALIINTVNFLDGLHGLTSGVTAIAAFFLFLLSIRPGFHHVDQSIFSMLALILSFTAAAFAIFDFSPAKILMGDTGSTFCGFILAVLAIFSGGKVATVFLIMGVPIMDVFWVVGRRIYNKQLPWKGDLMHLHHRLIYAGLSERQVVILMYAFTVLFGILALIGDTRLKLVGAGILLALMLVIALLVGRRKKV